MKTVLVCAVVLAALLGLCRAAPTGTFTFCHANGVAASLHIRALILMPDNTTTYTSPYMSYAACASLTVDYMGASMTTTILTVEVLGLQQPAQRVYYSPLSLTDASVNIAFLTQANLADTGITWTVRNPRTNMPNTYEGTSWVVYMNYATGLGSDIVFYSDDVAITSSIAFGLGSIINSTAAAMPAQTVSIKLVGGTTAIASQPVAAATAAMSRKTVFLAAIGNRMPTGESSLTILTVTQTLPAASIAVTACAFNSNFATGSTAVAVAGVSNALNYRACTSVAVAYAAGAMTRTVLVTVGTGPDLSFLYAPSALSPSRNFVVAIAGSDVPFAQNPLPAWAIVAPSIAGNPSLASGSARFLVLNAGLAAGAIDATAGKVDVKAVAYGSSAGADVLPADFAAVTVSVNKAGAATVYARANIAKDAFVADTTVLAVFSGGAGKYTVGSNAPTKTSTSPAPRPAAAAAAIAAALMLALAAVL